MTGNHRMNGKMIWALRTVFLTLLFLLSGFSGRTEVRAESMISTYYLPLEGTKLTQNAYLLEPVSNETTFLTKDWYVVNQDITMNNRLEIYGNVNLILADSKTLRCNAGIYIRENSTLTIWAQSSGDNAGVLIADLSGSEHKDAGIGSVEGHDGGSLVINGGKITARGGKGSAGIGGGYRRAFQGVTINRGIVEACGGNYENVYRVDGGAGIGSGYYSGPVPVTISGGTVTARGGRQSAGIGSAVYSDTGKIVIEGENTKVTAIGGYYGAGIGGGSSKNNEAIEIRGGHVTATGLGGGAGIGGGYNGYSNGITISGGTVRAYAKYQYSEPGEPDPSASPSNYQYIEVGAGIGGGQNGNGGDVTITGGDVLAYSSLLGAGIGGGCFGNLIGTITITGGKVTAVGGDLASGIGGGASGSQEGTINISGGEVVACGGSSIFDEEQTAAGIGGGRESSSASQGGEGGPVNITDGRVIAIAGGTFDTAIGHGYNDKVMGSLTLGNGMAVRWTNNVKDYENRALHMPREASGALTQAPLNDRVYKANHSRYVLIEKCSHPDLSSGNYENVSPEKHHVLFSCSYCGTSSDTFEAHTFDSQAHSCRCGRMEYLVKFHNEDGSRFSEKYYTEGTAAEEPATKPEKENYNFAGWYTKKNDDSLADNPYDFTTLITDTLYLYPNWTQANEQWTITFHDDTGAVMTGAYAPRKVWDGEQVSLPMGRIMPDGSKTFAGWYEKDESGNLKSDSFKAGTVVKRNYDLYEKWNQTTTTKLCVRYYPEYPKDGGKVITTWVEQGGRAVPPDDPKREGYTFAGWYQHDDKGEEYSNPYKFSDAVTAALDLYAGWKAPVYQVTFDAMGGKLEDGSSYKVESVADGAKVTRPADPKIDDGAVFAGWYLVNSPWDFSKGVSKNMTLAARWNREVSLTPPAAKDLSYNGSAQELVEAGSATGGTLQYALGQDADTAPDAPLYSTSIPEGTDVGTYYVWYRVIGDDGYKDTTPECIRVTIRPATSFVPYKAPTETKPGNKAYYNGNDGKLYWDALGLAEITDPDDVIIPPTGTKPKPEPEAKAEPETKTNTNTDTHKIVSSTSGGDSSSSAAGRRGVIVIPSDGIARHYAYDQAGGRTGSWSQDEGGYWHYTFENGHRARGEWALINYHNTASWYAFDENGIMRTGWFVSGGETYYLDQQLNHSLGAMVTGWRQILGKWYYFEPAPGAAQGRMYHGELTPDGYRVNADGTWDGKPAVKTAG
ncbi:MAG: InlB B-repeat-containing protein [Lachnospiraceae bacterium]|nr:InlB B-repeat-containing protein [Lachnospiraceae bacterium]